MRYLHDVRSRIRPEKQPEDCPIGPRLSNHFPLVSTSFGQLASAFVKFAALS